MSFGASIIEWYHKNKRDLPWRHTTDPYKIWLSEIILQQTRVDQGLDYYERFIHKFPDVNKLAAAREGQVLKHWQGLGYYSRARNLHHAAKDIVKRFNGNFPSDYCNIISLKGIGEYTAAAIASFAFKKKYAVVDGNVYRVLGRYLGIKTPIHSPAAKREFYEGATELMGDHLPDVFNQAIMEFGALQCIPNNPPCASCPLKNSCFAYSKNKVNEFPVKNKRTKPRTRHFHYLCIQNGQNIHMRRRTGNDIWKNMYDFPLIETTKRISHKELLHHDEWNRHFPEGRFQLLSKSKTIKHQLTHQTIYTIFYNIKTDTEIRTGGIKSVSLTNINRFAVPRLIENYINSALIK